MLPERSVLVDLDGVLNTGVDALYQTSLDEFVLAMNLLGFDAQEVRAKFWAEHNMYFTNQGYGNPTGWEELMEYVGEALHDTYHMVLADDIRADFRTIASSVHAPVPTSPLAENGLIALADYGYHLVCYTLGSSEWQGVRLHQTGLGRYFNEIAITNKKNLTALKKIRPHKGTWVVGDSPTHDIVPALEEGLRCVLIESVPPKFADESVYPTVRASCFYDAALDILEADNLRKREPTAA